VQGLVRVRRLRFRRSAGPRRSQPQREGQARRAGAAAWLPLALALGAGCAHAPAPAAVPPPALEPTAALEGELVCPRISHILVRKSERTLVARCAGGPAVAMRISLGRQPLGAKETQGDLRTPEGSYSVSGPPEPSRFHRFIPIDYPSRRDADAALAQGLIGSVEHARIVARRPYDRPPPQDTALGGELGLHGEGARWQGETGGLDWTFGCVAVRDHEIDFLAERVTPGTPVRIEP
jgi:hypothetical protein